MNIGAGSVPNPLVANGGFQIDDNTNTGLIINDTVTTAGYFATGFFAQRADSLIDVGGEVTPGNPACIFGGPEGAEIRLWFVIGVPPAGIGINGDFALRQDGAAGTSIYMKRAGAWVGIV